VRYPAPPFEGNKYIRPITDNHQLVIEETRLQNWPGQEFEVEKYASDRICCGNEYYYKVEYKGEEALIILYWMDFFDLRSPLCCREKWQYLCCDGPKRSEPSIELRKMAHAWFMKESEGL